MRWISTASQRLNPEEISQTHLFWLIEGLISISFTIESIVEIFILPENGTRWLLVIGVIDGVALIAFFMAREGYIRQAGWMLVWALWILFTGLAITENGVRAPTVDIAYLVIILVAGLILGERAGILMGLICSFTLLGLSLAGVQGLLPDSQVRRTNWSTWEADVFYLAITMGLQYLAMHSLKNALDQAHRELIERRRVEANLQKVEEERARSQMRVELHQLLEEQLDKERLKIARDLHDGPVQDLIGAIYSMESLIGDAPNETYKENMQSIQTLLQGEIRSLRTFAGELRSPTLTKFGLIQAIREHLESFQEKHPEIVVEIESSEDFPTLNEATRLALFRIYQEVMNNVVRHSRATRVSIQAGREDHSVCLTIQDDGIGFTPPSEWMELARGGHLGLVGIRERAEAIGGQVMIASQKGHGTTVEIHLPLLGDTI